MNNNTPKLPVAVTLQLPDWFDPRAQQWAFEPGDASAAMRLAIGLSQQNVEHRTGGPFAALVVALEAGRVISAAVNRVEAQSCSSAHAEMMALSLAQQHVDHWNLNETSDSPLTLITSAEPCAMCLGAIPWSGVKRVVCGATKADVEAAGFDEGARSGDWIGDLAQRGIDVEVACLRAQAAAVLMAYAQSDLTIYNP